jgi:hypothetical protein
MLRVGLRSGVCLLILSIIYPVPIFLHVRIVVLLISGNESFGLPVAKMGYRRRIRNGRQVKFWEDV